MRPLPRRPRTHGPRLPPRSACAVERQDPEAGLRDLDRLGRLSQLDAHDLTTKAYLLALAGRVHGAAAAYQAVLGLRPDCAASKHNLYAWGSLFFGKGEGGRGGRGAPLEHKWQPVHQATVMHWLRRLCSPQHCTNQRTYREVCRRLSDASRTASPTKQ